MDAAEIPRTFSLYYTLFLSFIQVFLLIFYAFAKKKIPLLEFLTTHPCFSPLPRERIPLSR